MRFVSGIRSLFLSRAFGNQTSCFEREKLINEGSLRVKNSLNFLALFLQDEETEHEDKTVYDC